MTMYTKKWVSILGDSISTFEGYTPSDGGAFYSRAVCGSSRVCSPEDTWWMKLIQKFDARLLVNNSYSGSGVSRFGYRPASSRQRTDHLTRDGREPDLILLFLGLNDVAAYTEEDQFSEDYATMLKHLSTRFPHAELWSSTLIRGFLPHPNAFEFVNFEIRSPLEVYNKRIRILSKEFGCHLADFSSMHASYASIDGVHPNQKGMEDLAALWYRCLSVRDTLV